MRVFLLCFVLAACSDRSLGVPTEGTTDGSTKTLDCSTLGEDVCASTAGCSAQICPGCGTPIFASCYETGTTPTMCPFLGCPAEPCSDFASVTACGEHAGCHAVYREFEACDCAGIDCCEEFAFCADGGNPSCSTDLTPTSCPFPPEECVGKYRPSYTIDGCQEGCVLAPLCACCNE